MQVYASLGVNKMNRRISQDFAFYLKKKGAYSSFIFYTKRTTNPYEMLDWFKWENTKQGYEYWKELLWGFAEYLTQKYYTNSVILN